MIVATSRRLTHPARRTRPRPHRRRSPKLADVEKEHIRAVLESTGWRIRGAGGAADRLGLKPTTLETRMAKLGLRRPGIGLNRPPACRAASVMPGDCAAHARSMSGQDAKC